MSDPVETQQIAQQVVDALEKHRNIPGIALALNSLSRATSSIHNDVSLGSVEKVRPFLSDINFTAARELTFKPVGLKELKGAVVLDVGKLWKATNPGVPDTEPERLARAEEVLAAKGAGQETKR